MKNINLKKTLIQYFILQAIGLLLILIAVFVFNYSTKNSNAESILINIRNDLLVGDFRTVNQTLSNAQFSGFSSIEVFNERNVEILSTENQPRNKTLSIKKNLSTSMNSGPIVYTIIFHYSLSTVFKNSLLIWTLFALMALPYIYFEKRKLDKKYLVKLKEEKDLIFKTLAMQVSHDIRSPLAVINTLKHDFNKLDDAELIHFSNAVDRINLIANNLLQTTNHSNMILEELDLTSFIKLQIEQKSIETSVEISYLSDIKQNCKTQVSKLELSRIISNILNNSIESIPNYRKKEIKVELKADKDFSKIIMSDNGIGITKSHLGKLGKENFTTKELGHGLGLTHAKLKIEAMSGSLLIESIEDTGTIITITLPRVQSKISNKYILIDNDELVRVTWEIKAKKSQIDLQTFNSKDELSELIKTLDKETIFYIDSELGNIKGEEFALELFNIGFKNLNITSGHPPEHFKKYSFLKTIISKNPPF